MNIKPLLTPLACLLLMNVSAHAASVNDFKTSLIAPVRRTTCMTTITTTTSVLIHFSTSAHGTGICCQMAPQQWAAFRRRTADRRVHQLYGQ